MNAPAIPGAAVAATREALANIERWNPVINAMITVTADRALQRAAELDAAAAAGEWCGLLHGLVVNLKDNIDLEGVPTTGATVLRRGHRAERNAFITDRLERNGAVIVGKSNLHEWVFGPTSQSRHFGPVRNPWNPGHIPGGSSGGSGASVAADMAAVSIGSDTAGSIRIPASFNGVAGLRPTVGRISGRGSLGVSAAFDTLGPLARRVSDVARVFAVIAGHDPHDPISVDTPVPNFLPTLSDPVRGMRIGVMRSFFFDGLHPDLAPATERAIGVFRDLGVKIVDVDLGDVEKAQEMLAFRMVVADAMEVHRDRVAAHAADYGEDIRMRLRIGEQVTGVQYAEALRWMERFRHRLRAAFGEVDAMLSPTTAIPAPAIEGLDFGEAIRAVPRLTCVYAAAGVPGLALPCGFTADGLPLSMELAGPAFGEPQILRLGHAFQGVTDFHLRRPKLPR
ncbi:amidase [Ramlibacter alkalitolerans]|uniref:Amidase n=1 Tax=Ramlibacter alkalitolerans TaxID=2039631 RepID=A0ABS1JK05_9BURK|nr:amidase [Ramlibacter alkalitolerans]MBL0424558.1 amidase [Ramlibacter alkalitolerans]